MTPKEKAEDLLLKYSILKDGHNDLVKKCALIAVDEILDTIVVIYSKDFKMLNKYWGEVRHEINKL
jgi:hypothetical protein